MRAPENDGGAEEASAKPGRYAGVQQKPNVHFLRLVTALAVRPLASRLYLLLLCSVLALGGCSQDRSNPTSDTSANSTRSSSDTVAATTSSAGKSRDRTSAPGAVRVLVLGNSIAAGYGLEDPATQSFPARLQQRIDSLGWSVEVRNAGLSGETTAGGLRRIQWLLQQPVDVLVLELGGNDGLRGVDPSATKENLTAIVDTTLSRYPDAHVVLAGMQIPPNLGPEYTEAFRSLYPDIAASYDPVSLVPFVLEGVGGVDSLMQDDQIPPTTAGQRLVANNVWDVLRPVLERRLQQPGAASE